MATEENDVQAAMELAGDAAKKRRSLDFRRRVVKPVFEEKQCQTNITTEDLDNPILKLTPLMNLTHMISVAFALVTGTLSQLKLFVTSCGSHSYYYVFVGLLLLSLMFHFCVAGVLMLLTKREIMTSSFQDTIEKLNLYRLVLMFIASVTLINICIFMLA